MNHMNQRRIAFLDRDALRKPLPRLLAGSTLGSKGSAILLGPG